MSILEWYGQPLDFPHLHECVYSALMVLWTSFVILVRIMSKPQVVSERMTFVAGFLHVNDGKEN